MAEGPDKDDKTQPPSGRRLERARDEGQVALSPELPTLAVLAAAAVLLTMSAPGIGRALVGRLGILVEQSHLLGLGAATRLAVEAMAIAALPFLLAAIVAASASDR